MDGKTFLRHLTEHPVYIRLRKDQDVVQDWTLQRLITQEHKGEVVLITPFIGWAEYSPKYDIELFDGYIMTFMAEEYIMEVRL